MDKEDIKILDLILDKLVEQHAQDKSAFRCSFSDSWDEFEGEDGGWFTARNKTMSISWKPKAFSWKPDIYNHNNRVELTYYVSDQTVSISLDEGRRDIYLGGGSQNKGVKIKFVQLFNEIADWMNVEIPRKNREKFINATTKTFPDILDLMILEDHDDSEEDGDD